MEDEDFPLLLFRGAVVDRRRLELLAAFHERVPHHVFGPEVERVDNVPVLVLVRVPAVDDRVLLDDVIVLAGDEIDQSLRGDALEILVLAGR